MVMTDIADTRRISELDCDPLQDARQARLNHLVDYLAAIAFSSQKAVLLHQS